MDVRASREVVLFKPDALGGSTSMTERSRAADLVRLLRFGLVDLENIEQADPNHSESLAAARLANRRIVRHAAEHSWYALKFPNLHAALGDLAELEARYSDGGSEVGVRNLGMDLWLALGFDVVGSETFLVTEQRFDQMYRPSDMKVPRAWLSEYFVGSSCEAVVLESTGGGNSILQVAKEYLRGILQAGTSEYLPTVLREADATSRRLSNFVHVCDPGAHEADYLASLVPPQD